MTQHARKREEMGRVRRAAETAVDFAVGGAAFAAEKGLEAIDRFTQRGERALRKGERAARETASETRQKAAEATATVRKAFEPSDSRSYEERTREELYELASEREVDGRSSMTKDELIAALRAQR